MRTRLLQAGGLSVLALLFFVALVRQAASFGMVAQAHCWAEGEAFVEVYADEPDRRITQTRFAVATTADGKCEASGLAGARAWTPSRAEVSVSGGVIADSEWRGELLAETNAVRRVLSSAAGPVALGALALSAYGIVIARRLLGW